MENLAKEMTMEEYAKMRQDFVNKADDNTDFRQVYLEDIFVFRQLKPYDPFLQEWCDNLREKILDCDDKITLDHKLTFEHMSLMQYINL